MKEKVLPHTRMSEPGWIASSCLIDMIAFFWEPEVSEKVVQNLSISFSEIGEQKRATKPTASTRRPVTS